jgi:hypothetical protein
MGLLEYQAMPSLRDVAHDGWLCTFIKLQLVQQFRLQGEFTSAQERFGHFFALLDSNQESCRSK